MHPADIAARGLAAGDVVLVESRIGSALAGLVPSPDVARGVVQLSTGAWFDPSAPDVATCVHGNPNALTTDVGTSRLAQGCTGQLARVEVRRAPLVPTRRPRPLDPPNREFACHQGAVARLSRRESLRQCEPIVRNAVHRREHSF
jgi:biotin/methionine sulfoxide reductase